MKVFLSLLFSLLAVLIMCALALAWVPRSQLADAKTSPLLRRGSDATAFDRLSSLPDTMSKGAVPAATPTCSAGGQLGPWSYVAPFLGPFDSPASASDGTNVYIAGGYSNGYANELGRYDPGANSWTYLAPLPASMAGARAAFDANNNEVYVFGGVNGSGVLSTTYAYDIGTNTWTTAAPMPAGRYYPGVVYFGGTGKIYLIGGFDSNYAEQSQVWEYDPVANAWNTSRADSFVPMTGSATTTWGQYLYVMGSYNSGNGSNINYRYDVAADTWLGMSSIPDLRYLSAAGVVDGKIYLFGGGNPFNLTGSSAGRWGKGSSRVPAAYSTSWIYDIAGNSWSAGTSMNTARGALGGGAIGNLLIAVGGYNTAGVDTATAELASVNCGGATATPVPTSSTPTSTPSALPSETPTVCTLTFSDVPPGSTFYPYIRCLACLGLVNGYADGSFKPNTNVTRGQLSKIVSNSAGFSDPQPNQMFQDVPIGSTFQVFIGRLASRGYINGYPCGGPGEQCVPPANLPYFRPNNNATRGQISKIDANAAGFSDPPSGRQFEDVPVGSAFYTYTYRLVSRGVMSGYPCGGLGEPCVPPTNLPYFRPGNNATRGQTSKIVANTFFPDCQTPEKR